MIQIVSAAVRLCAVLSALMIATVSASAQESTAASAPEASKSEPGAVDEATGDQRDRDQRGGNQQAASEHVEGQPAEDGKSGEAETSTPAEPNLNAKRGPEKRKKALVGLAAVAGIAILGVGAIAVTMVWARRLRRLARKQDPPQKTAGNDFWFLKPPKPLVSERNPGESPRQPPHSQETLD